MALVEVRDGAASPGADEVVIQHRSNRAAEDGYDAGDGLLGELLAKAAGNAPDNRCV